ncbi:hypothetical protein VOLCADRAFT_117504 [Volvox carteri f. nagariensis]|uniref:Uncharacterized protein n=1 Tax=Volvox carteri f. nagariensis TaxID=3068 RepID=D8TVH4_VOLCA|nr:uncharacterized protein VOLCADRAFT_117504 [Volvox carteri f. nagariensis]EFJ48578.1 hypothetical protein VOLCADRAFT_117504 [Volvox carteri f. nagariensis]|eukprot:XP_002950377.1 hypothetical protein VOLCADRAFT_117504 [Volvox carteri f. nagariensis]
MSRAFISDLVGGSWLPSAKSQALFLPFPALGQSMPPKRPYQTPPSALPRSQHQAQSQLPPRPHRQLNNSVQQAAQAARRRRGPSGPGADGNRSSGSGEFQSDGGVCGRPGSGDAAAVRPGYERLVTPRRQDRTDSRRRSNSRGRGDGGANAVRSRSDDGADGDLVDNMYNTYDTHVDGNGDSSVDGSGGGGGDGGDGPLQGSLAEELQELERMYGAADRTRSSYRSRQRWLDRRAAEREVVYGPRHRDADVRLLALRRHLAAAGKLRRRGRFAPNDSLPRASTWHKLPPATQRSILDERASELQREVGLQPQVARRMYVAAPGLLCDISYGVAARLRALAARLGCSVEGAAAAIASRPLLAQLRVDQLEATAAEISTWVGWSPGGGGGGDGGGGGVLPLSLAMQRLAQEPSLAAEGSMALISSGAQLASSVTLLQRLLGLSPPAAAAMVIVQPALALLPPAELAAAVDFLAANVPPPTGAHSPGLVPPPMTFSAAVSSPATAVTARRVGATAAAAADQHRPPDGLSQGQGRPGGKQRRLLSIPPPQPPPSQQQQQQLPPLHVQLLVQRYPDILLLEPSRAASALGVLARILRDAAAETAAAAVAATVPGSDRAAELVRVEPRLLLCQLIPPIRQSDDGGREDGSGVMVRDRRITILSLVKAIEEAHRKRRVDAASLALDSADWPRPLVRLPYEYDAGTVAPADGGLASVSVLDDELGAPRPEVVGGNAAATAGGEAALLAAAAVAGVGTIPVDLGLREAELLRIILPGLLMPLGQEPPALQASGAAPYDRPYGTSLAVEGSGWNLDVARSWLWREVIAAEPGLLLLPPAQLAATTTTLCAWLAVPLDALSYYLFPCGPSILGPTASVRQLEPRGRGASPASTSEAVAVIATGTEAAKFASPHGPLRSRRSHAALLTRRQDTLQRAGYLVWDWLGGAAAATAADVAEVLRALPSLMYDSVAMHTCARVLHALVDECDGITDAGGSGDGDADTSMPGDMVVQAPAAAAFEITGFGLPAWVLVSPPSDEADPWVGADLGSGAAEGRQAQDPTIPPPPMPAAAAALLLQFPSELLSGGVLQLLLDATPTADTADTAPAADVAVEALAAPELNDGPCCGAAQEVGGGDSAHFAVGRESSGGTLVHGKGRRGSRLYQAVRGISELLGVGRLAAAALVLATQGSAALLVEGLSSTAIASVKRVISAVRRGDAWRRELRRYLYGNTSSYGSGALGISEQAQQGGNESLKAVSASAWELLCLLREWRRASRLEALVAAGWGVAAVGLEGAVSFATVLQLPDDEWGSLAQHLQLAAKAHPDE